MDENIKSEPVKPTGITIRDTQTTSLMNPEVYVQMKILAQDFINSKAIPQCWTTASQVLVGLQTGLEMGMQPMEAMNSLYVVNGAVNVWGKALTRRLTEHGYEVDFSEETEEQTTAIVSKDGKDYVATFKFSDAELSGYTKDSQGRIKVGWKPGQNRKLKLRYGALSEIIKTQLPHVMGSASGVAEIDNDIERVTIPNTNLDENKLLAIAEAAKEDEDVSES